ncbi:hypothetical protein RJ639_023617 [Escallonia herrerae]|uniref:Uncharacterized protein n=1 Tax=Escallonia herrerae TaxID=1293975 RepID=A0AA89AE41_9ASTE|nr:hypothetical protein RJ639_023617 [Escallonia herrerae]
MKVQIQSKKFIKPSTPTAPSLRNYNLSFLDELAPATKVDTQLQGPLGLGEAEKLNHLIPCEIGAFDEISDPLLPIQLTISACGRLAIGGRCSHRTADAFTLATFICGWATAGQEQSVDGICPSLNSVSFFQGRGGEDGCKVVIDPLVESNKNLSNSEMVVNIPVKNVVILMDDIKSEGIEAWVHLDKREMPYFEQDCDIQAFTT